MNDYYIIEWRFRKPDPMLFNYWRKHGKYYGGGTLTTEFTEDQVRQELPSLKENDRIEFKIIRVTFDEVDPSRFA